MQFSYLIFVAAIMQLWGVGTYIRDTVRGTTKPNRVTWLLWAVAPLIATIAALSKGVEWSVLPVFMSGFGPFLVFLASYRNKGSYWKLTKFDYWCGAFSILALIFWALTKDPNVAILFAIMSDGLAAVPTLIKAWHHPETESVSPYVTGLFSALTSFTAIQRWNVTSVAFPLYLVGICTILTLVIMRGRYSKR